MNDLELPDCHVGFYEKLVGFRIIAFANLDRIHWVGRRRFAKRGFVPKGNLNFGRDAFRGASVPNRNFPGWAFEATQSSAAKSRDEFKPFAR